MDEGLNHRFISELISQEQQLKGNLEEKQKFLYEAACRSFSDWKKVCNSTSSWQKFYHLTILLQRNEVNFMEILLGSSWESKANWKISSSLTSPLLKFQDFYSWIFEEARHKIHVSNVFICPCLHANDTRGKWRMLIFSMPHTSSSSDCMMKKILHILLLQQ